MSKKNSQEFPVRAKVCAASVCSLILGLAGGYFIRRVQEPSIDQASNYITINTIRTEKPGYAKGLECTFTPEQCRNLRDYAPVSFDIPKLQVHFALSLDPALKHQTLTFNNPKSIDGEVLYLIGTTPEGNVMLGTEELHQ